LFPCKRYSYKKKQRRTPSKKRKYISPRNRRACHSVSTALLQSVAEIGTHSAMKSSIIKNVSMSIGSPILSLLDIKSDISIWKMYVNRHHELLWIRVATLYMKEYAYVLFVFGRLTATLYMKESAYVPLIRFLGDVLRELIQAASFFGSLWH
jgi:hypothetical protein